MWNKLKTFFSVKRNRVFAVLAFILLGIGVFCAFLPRIKAETVSPDRGCFFSNSVEAEVFDTDGDGLSDELEEKVYFTSPTMPDTDGDGIWDGDEVTMGLNPLEKNTQGIVRDAKRKFSYEVTAEGAKLSTTGFANIASTNIEISDIDLGGTPGVASAVYELSIQRGTFKTASVSISYDPASFEELGISQENLAVYQFLDDGSFLLVGGDIDVENHTVSASLAHFSKYFLADKTLVSEPIQTQVVLLIDNSGSMFSEEDCPGSPANDVDFKRLELAKEIVNSTSDLFSFAVGRFSYSTTMMTKGFLSDKNELTATIESIRSAKQTFDGTGLYRAIKAACSEFSYKDKVHRKIIVLLTDGETTESSWFYDVYDAIEIAKKYDVTVITIGVGSDIDANYLTALAKNTGGTYVHASTADVLTRISSVLVATLNYRLADRDGDGVNDSILLADSGFDIQTDAFPFKNYLYRPSYNESVTEGQCAGMARLCEKYYNKTLKLTGDAIPSFKATGFLVIGGYLEAQSYNLKNHPFFASGDVLKNCHIDATLDSLLKPESDNVFDRYDTTIKNDHLSYKKEILDYIAGNPLIEVMSYGDDTLKKFTENGKTYYYKTYDFVCFKTNGVSVDELTEEQKNSYNLLIALENFFARQNGYDVSNPINLSSAAFEHDANINALYKLCDILGSGKIVTMDGPCHTVNLVRIYRSLSDTNVYYFEVYDNNSPNKTKFLEVRRSFYKGYELDIDSYFNDVYFTIYDTDDIFGKAGGKISATFTVDGAF